MGGAQFGNKSSFRKPRFNDRWSEMSRAPSLIVRSGFSFLPSRSVLGGYFPIDDFRLGGIWNPVAVWPGSAVSRISPWFVGLGVVILDLLLVQVYGRKIQVPPIPSHFVEFPCYIRE